MKQEVRARDREMAETCLKCTVCKKARKNQEGFYILVRQEDRGWDVSILPGL